MKGFNPYNFYVILYGTPTYGDVSVCAYMGYWLGAYVRILVFVFFLVTHS